MITEVLAGRIDFFVGPVGIVLSHIREGTLIALAVNSPKRASALPDVPTMAEAGVADAEYPNWFGIFLPAKTPRDIVNKLHRETLNVLQAPNVAAKLAKIGIDPMVITSDQFDAHVKSEIGMNAALVKATGIKAN
jgi:tripartite-type tricarboxylate transporter receptor subunit TctC